MNSLAIVDDDMMSREMIALLAEDAGYTVTTYESGEESLKALSLPAASAPETVLIDMQMPGLQGDPLAIRLRAVCGAGVRLIAMSGSEVAEDARQSFNGFLMKPFSGEELRVAVEAGETHAAVIMAPGDAAVLSDTTFASILHTMPKEQVRKLYAMCLDDVDRRIGLLQQASATRDADAFMRTAHSIKGGCGMVGALELAALATVMEQDGMPAVHSVVPFEDFLRASARLRGMLGRILDVT